MHAVTVGTPTYTVHWFCRRCWRNWDAAYVLEPGREPREESMTLDICCEACAGKTQTEINRLRKKHQRKE